MIIVTKAIEVLNILNEGKIFSGCEVGTAQKFVKFLTQKFDHVLFNHIRLFFESDMKKVDQLT